MRREAVKEFFEYGLVLSILAMAVLAPPAAVVNGVANIVLKASARTYLGEKWEAWRTQSAGCIPSGGCLVRNDDGRYALGGFFGFRML